MELYDAIYRRRSIRRYELASLSESVLEGIRVLCGNPKKLHDIQTQVHVVEDGSRMHSVIPGIIGSYGKVRAPHYLVVTSEAREGYLENVGYLMESIVLELTRQGIGTCWIGGKIERRLLAEITDIADHHEVVIVISFGNPQSGVKLFRSKGGRRKGLSELVLGDADETWQTIIDAARVAPSAMNGQPWRFACETAREVNVYIKRSRLLNKHLAQLNHIDIGIALRHLQIAAENLGERVSFRQGQGKPLSGHEYVISMCRN